MPEVKVHIDMSGVKAAVLRAAGLTMEALHTDIVSAQVVPFDLGDMQGALYTTPGEDYGDSVIASLESPSPQARRFFYHPEYNYQTVNNPNARGDWPQPWTEGDKKDFIQNTFTQLLKEELGQ